MDKRARFIAELRREAKKRKLTFREEKDRGKGGHSMVWVGTEKVKQCPGARSIRRLRAR
jgi:hypothetical protein